MPSHPSLPSPNQALAPLMDEAEVGEITRLFAALATSIRQPDDPHAGADASLAISSLTSSLNPPSHSSSRVLDAALSLMCFKAPEVWSWNVIWLVETMTTTLSATVSCRVARGAGREERLVVGSSVGCRESDELVEACLGVLESLEEHAISHDLLPTVLKVAATAPKYQNMFPLSPVYYENVERPARDRRELGSRLYCVLSNSNISKDDEVSSRLLLWYLHPLSLKNDFSNILRDTIGRPFLELKDEFHVRMSWRFIMKCLITSPTVFAEIRTLLHNWFLLTGMSSVRELQVALISSVLDVLSRPQRWGLSAEMGLKLPFSHAYFPSKHCELLSILTASISCESFCELVHLIRVWDMQKLDVGHNVGSSKFKESTRALIDSNSTWSILINFPSWFFFATILVFSARGPQQSQDHFVQNVVSKASHIDMQNGIELYHAASMYVAFILCPFDQTCQSLLVSCINELSRSLPGPGQADCTSQQMYQLEKSSRSISARSKKLRNPRISGSNSKIQGMAEGHRTAGIKVWLQQFHGLHTKFYDKASIHAFQGRFNRSMKSWSSLLIAKIPLGLLLTSCEHFDEECFGMLYHYAVTGEISNLEGTNKLGDVSEQNTMKYSYGCRSACPEKGNANSWIAGASAVLHFFDIILDTTESLFEVDNLHMDFICQVKGKSVGYLVNCVRNILELLDHNIERKDVMLMDLYCRLVRWKQLGGEVFKGCDIIDGVLNSIREKGVHCRIPL